ncbi:MAG: AIR synthase family protein [Clostridiales Family XIII bacterium]|jgi:hydrogenase expression/formation protein HypE|nr:AIR synthase family protein [Clostridiales Family XIII bacterium]
MRIGKLDNETLARLVLGKTGASREEVITGASIGEDCAVLDFGTCDCILSTDPITASADRIGALAVHISCNDIAAHGTEPAFIMLTVLLPPSITEDEIGEIARQSDAAARELGVSIVGGHTEITDSVNRPLVSAVAIGRAAKQGAKEAPAPGDIIIVTKSLALEGTGILAEKYADKLRRILTDEESAAAKAMLDRVSVVKEGVAAGRVGVSAMHDITEGGVLGAVWEVCTGKGVGAEIELTSLPFEDVTLDVCAFLGIDPLRLISSGSMLIVTRPDKEAEMTAAIEEAGAPGTVIGRVSEAADGIVLIGRTGERETIGSPGPDEVYKVVFEEERNQ